MDVELDRPTLRSEELVGLGLAAVAHVALVAVLLIQATDDVDTIAPPDRMAVSLTDGEDLANISPNPGDERFAPGAPVESSIENVVPPVPTPDQPVVDPATNSSAASTPRPTPTPSASRAPKKKPDPKKTTGSQGGGAAASKKTGDKSDTGFGGAFGGASGETTAQAKKNINVSIAAQVLPKWNSCRISGLDIDKLRAKVSFRMDSNGRITSIGTPQVTGQTASNSAQAGRFGECAVRALRLVGQFTNLPSDRHDLFSSYEFTFRKE